MNLTCTSRTPEDKLQVIYVNNSVLYHGKSQLWPSSYSVLYKNVRTIIFLQFSNSGYFNWFANVICSCFKGDCKIAVIETAINKCNCKSQLNRVVKRSESNVLQSFTSCCSNINHILCLAMQRAEE